MPNREGIAHEIAYLEHVLEEKVFLWIFIMMFKVKGMVVGG